MGLTGDFAKLRTLDGKIAKVSSSSMLMRELAKVLGATALTEVQRGFREQRDPYGVPWRPLKRARTRNRRGRGRTSGARTRSRILLNTGRLRSSYTFTVTSKGFRIGTNVIYATTHQFGRGPIPQRPMMPLRARGLPPLWKKAFDAEASKFLRRAFG